MKNIINFLLLFQFFLSVYLALIFSDKRDIVIENKQLKKDIHRLRMANKDLNKSINDLVNYEEDI